MNIQHLKYAVEVERAGSISQAAEKLYMNQPNLSKAIKELETSLGIAIFRRTSKGMVPTVEGSEFLGYARNILEQVEQVEALYSPSNTNKLTFRISVPRSSYIAYAFTSFLNELERGLEIEMSFRETNSMRTIKNVLEDGCQLGVIRYQMEYEEYFLRFLSEKKLAHEDIMEFGYALLVSKKSPLAAMQNIDFTDLSDYIEVLHGDMSIPYLSVDENRADNEHRCKKRIFVYARGSQFDLLSRIDDTYMWTAPMPPDVLERNALVQQPCVASRHRYKDVLIYHSGYKFGDMDKAFLQKLEETKNLIKSENPNI